MLVDDDEFQIYTVKALLEKEGYQVLTASNGIECLGRIKSQIPDLMILDIQMPVMDGWALVRRLRALPDLALVPVIFLTSLDSPEDRMKGFQLGADDFLRKPFIPQVLLKCIASVLKEKEKQTESLEKGEATISPEMERAATTTMRFDPTSLGMKKIVPPPEEPVLKIQFDLSGSLSQFGVPSLLSLFFLERKTGILVLEEQETGAVGKCYIKQGLVFRVDVFNPVVLENLDAVYELLHWSHGSFAFKNRPVDRENEINLTTTQLLLSGMEQLDTDRRDKQAENEKLDDAIRKFSDS